MLWFNIFFIQRCDKVIGLSTMDGDISSAERTMMINNIHNASFIKSTPKDVHTKCSPLVKRCISVAVLNLASSFGKSNFFYHYDYY